MKEPVLVTGASGYVGSWLIMKLLRAGYTVRGIVRDPSNEKVKPLLDLPGSAEQLTIWKADLDVEGSFDEAMKGCEGVFHVASPVDFESTDPENEVIKPTIKRTLNILRSCKNAGTVKRVVFTSSAGTVDVEEHQLAVYDESSWSDIDFCRRVKMGGWMYFVSQTLAEKAAWEYVKEHNLDFISIIPPLVVGPFMTTSMPPILNIALALILGNEGHYSIIRHSQLIHLDDLCDAHVFLYEHPDAEGRHICCSRGATIYELADMMQKRYPQYKIPQKFEGIDHEDIQRVHFSSKKLLDLGFKFRYTMEDMFDAAIQSCREKKLIPFATVETDEVHDLRRSEKVNGFNERNVVLS